MLMMLNDMVKNIQKFPITFSFLAILYGMLFYTAFTFSTSVEVVAKTPNEVILRIEK
jgi:hypothetical protein